MNTVLVILTQSNLTTLNVHESLSATMVLATFGCEVSVVLKDAAISLLASELEFNTMLHAFKHGSNMVDSFEFYDIDPIYIENRQRLIAEHYASAHNLEFIDLNAEFIQKFDHVLYW